MKCGFIYDTNESQLYCKNPGKNIHVKIYKTTAMGHIFQVEWWAKHTCGCSFRLIWLRKLAKAKANGLERQNGIFGTFIYENNGN